MTGEELAEDLVQLVVAGLVYVDYDHGPRPLPRFALTARGRAHSWSERLFRDQPSGRRCGRAIDRTSTVTSQRAPSPESSS
jgi:hypothetical protein